jgi:CBS domain-containing protein
VSRIEPPAFGSEIFDLTMKGLEAGLKVGDIATYGFHSCGVDDDAAEVMTRADLLQFDCIPVRNGERVVGVLERNGELASGPAREAMRRLDDGLLVSSNEPLKGFIPLLAESPHRLVVRGTRIEGIVTRSDVHKLPVRLLAFALVTHLEMTMAEVIISRSSDDDWRRLMSEGRQRKVMEKFEQLRTENFDPPLIEMTEFADKRCVLAKMGVLDFPGKSKAVKVFERIEELRNKVAHAATYAESVEQLADFIQVLQLTEAWIWRLSQSQESGAG